MSTSPSLRATYDDFIASLNGSSDLLNRAGKFEELRRGKTRRLLPGDVQAIAELSFLSAFLSWENFLESTFILYMTGKSSPSRFRPTRYVAPPDSTHAFKIVAQGRSYADWVMVKDLRQRAEWYFQGGDPYANALRSASGDLEDMRIIRHRIAHRSKSAHTTFEDRVRHRLGSVPKGATPGSYLLMVESPGRTFFDYYIAVLKAVALQIVPH